MQLLVLNANRLPCGHCAWQFEYDELVLHVQLGNVDYFNNAATARRQVAHIYFEQIGRFLVHEIGAVASLDRFFVLAMSLRFFLANTHNVLLVDERLEAAYRC